jgi:stalled ribosome rescue protein Dom34
MHNNDSEGLVDLILSKITKSIKKARSNYRHAVPQFFRDKGNEGDGELQLLLPIELVKDQPVAVAIRLEERELNGTIVYEYMIKTLLTMEMACSNARLLQKIDQDWLTAYLSEDKEEEDQTPAIVTQNPRTVAQVVQPAVQRSQTQKKPSTDTDGWTTVARKK